MLSHVFYLKSRLAWQYKYEINFPPFFCCWWTRSAVGGPDRRLTGRHAHWTSAGVRLLIEPPAPGTFPGYSLLFAQALTPKHTLQCTDSLLPSGCILIAPLQVALRQLCMHFSSLVALPCRRFSGCVAVVPCMQLEHDCRMGPPCLQLLNVFDAVGAVCALRPYACFST
jgi:hypothetical protein